MFAYGCLSAIVSLFAFVWFCFRALSPGGLTPDDDALGFLAARAMVLHLGAVVLTWAPYNSRLSWFIPRYPPLLHPDRKKQELGRAIVITTTVCAVVVGIIVLGPNRSVLDRRAMAGVLFSVIGLALTSFVAAFWALGPEHLFPQWMLRALSWDPSFSSLGRLRAKRGVPPLETWLATLLECCEKVAASPPSEIDCLNLKTELNAQLESRIYLVQHRRLLTHEGFRVIRRFIQAVDALDCGAPNVLAQQSVVGCAKQVLESRDGLANPG